MSIFSPYVLIGIVVAVLGAYGGGRFQQYTRDLTGFQKKVDKMVADAAEAKAQEDARLAKVAMNAAVEQAAKEKTRAKQMADANARIKSLSAALSSTRVPDVAWMLNRSIGDQADAAGTAAKPSQSAAAPAANPDTTIGLWAQWSVDCINYYIAARDQVIGLQTFYNGLRNGAH